MTENTGKLYVVVSRQGGTVMRDPSRAAQLAILTSAHVVVIDIEAGEFDSYCDVDLLQVGAAVEDVLSAAPGEFRQSIE